MPYAIAGCMYPQVIQDFDSFEPEQEAAITLGKRKLQLRREFVVIRLTAACSRALSPR